MTTKTKRINACAFLTLFVFLLGNNYSFAQLSKEDKLDSLQAKFKQDSSHIYRYRPLKFLFAIDKRNSFINTNAKVPVQVGGLQIGVVLKEHHSMGLGFYSISHTQVIHPVEDPKRSQNVKLNMGYVTGFWEYTLVDTRYWEIGFPLEMGLGNYQTLVTDTTGKRVPEFKDTLKRGILLLGAGFDIDFKFFRWAGVNLMGGYRLVGGNEPNKVNFNGVFYSFGLNFYFGELLKLIRLKRWVYKRNVRRITNSSP
jgi:hypothetical protein